MLKTLREQLADRNLQIIVRGITSIEDALTAAEQGASAIWITEKAHLQSAATPISILHNIALTLANLHPNCSVFMQGGIRRGTDVLKAVAMGAKAVFLDIDTVMWGLVRDGNSQGLVELLTMLNEELKLSMVLTHSADIASIKAERVIEWVQAKP